MKTVIYGTQRGYVKHSLLTAVAMLFSLFANATYYNSWSVGNLTWKLSSTPLYTAKFCGGYDDIKAGRAHINITSVYYKNESDIAHLTIPTAVGWKTGGSSRTLYPYVYGLNANAFRDCLAIKTITIPGSMDNWSTLHGLAVIGQPCFRGCSNLTSITFDVPDEFYNVNIHDIPYRTVDGVLYNGKMTILNKYPEGKAGDTYTVPSSVKELTEYCLSNTKLTTIYFQGNAPAANSSTIFAGSKRLSAICYPQGATGWTNPWKGIRTYAVPNAVTGLSATQGASEDDVTLMWSPNPIATSYVIYRTCVEDGDKVQLATHSGSTVYSDTSALAGVVYYYSVAARNGNYDGVPSETVQGWKKKKPTYLTVTLNSLGGSLGAVDSVLTIEQGKSIGELPEPFLAGFTFNGWWTDIMGGERIEADAIVNDNYTYFAHWKSSNDDFVHAKEIKESAGCIASTLRAATVEEREVGWPFDVNRTVWYKWTAPFTGPVTFAVKNMNLFQSGVYDNHDTDGVLYLVTTRGYDEEEEAWIDYEISEGGNWPEDYGGYGRYKPCEVTFDAEIGETYYVAVATDGDSSDARLSNLELSWGFALEVEDGIVNGYKGIIPEQVEIPEGVTAIGEKVFAYEEIKSIKLPASLRSIEKSAFNGCWRLESVEGLRDDIEIGALAFAGTPFDATRPFGFDVVNGVLVGIHGQCPECISVPEGITDIAEEAFSGFVYEYDEDEPSTVDSLKCATIPASVSRIGLRAFEECENLTSVVIGNPCIVFDGAAFVNCENLESINVSNAGHVLLGWKLTGYSAVGMFGEMVCNDDLPEGAEEIIDADIGPFTSGLPRVYSYYDEDGEEITDVYYSQLHHVWVSPVWEADDPDVPGPDVSLPAGYNTYNDGTYTWVWQVVDGGVSLTGFWGCSDLDDSRTGAWRRGVYPEPKGVLTIPSAVNGMPVVGLDMYLCVDCSEMTGVVIPETVEWIFAAFVGSGIKSVHLPDSVRIVGADSFYETKLERINVPKNLEYVSGRAFLKTPWLQSQGDWAFFGDGNLIAYQGVDANADVPNSASVICEMAFSQADVTTVNIPNTVTKIWSLAFSGCESLESVSISDSVEEIDDYVFSKCKSLTTINIPASVARIGNWVFSDCKSLTEVRFDGNMPEMGESAFDGVSNACTLKVRRDSTGWGVDVSETWNGLQVEYASLNVMFDLNYADAQESIPPAVVTNGFAYGVLPTPVRNGYIFLGWYTAKEGGSRIMSETIVTYGAGHTLYAQWTADGSSDIPGPDVSLPAGYSTYNDGTYTWVWQEVDGGVALTGFWGRSDPDDFYTGAWRRGVYPEPKGVLTIPSDINGVPVVELDYALCMDCKEMTGVVIPETVVRIKGAFAYSGIKSVHLPDSVREIGNDSFFYTPLESINVPQNLECVSGWAFSNTPWLRAQGEWAFFGEGNLIAYQGGAATVTVPNTVRVICECAFNQMGVENVVIPTSVKRIGSDAFYGCESLVKVSILGSLEEIDDSAFYGCESLAMIDIQASVARIGDWAFRDCKSLVKVSMLASLEEIGYSAFSGCESLTMIDIPASVARIGDWAFRDCKSLAEVRFGGNAPEIGEDAFEGVPGTCTAKVPRDSTGWDVDIPGTWNGMRIEYSSSIVTLNENGGYVIGGKWGFFENGKKIGSLPEAWRDDGYVFNGWWTAKTGGKRVTEDTVVTKDITLYAHWTPAWTVTLKANGGSLDGADNKIPFAKGKAIGATGLRELPTPVRAGYAFKGWYTKKSGGTKVTAKTKVTKNVTWYAQWKVKKYAVKVTKFGKGTVTGTGSKAYKSKVTLKAKAAKGYVFQGWYETGNGEQETGNGERLVSRKASYSFTVSVGGRTLVAKFLTTAQDKAGIGLTVDGVGVGASGLAGRETLPAVTNVCGVAIEAVPIAASGLTPVSITVTGLPTGLKYDTKKKAITGVPTAAKSFTAKVTVKSLGASRSWSVKWVVAPLPSWAVGTFNGIGAFKEKNADVTMTVGKTGKISGKFTVDGKQYSFTAPSFTEHVENGALITTKGTMKNGTKTYKVEIAVTEGEAGSGVALIGVMNGTAEIAGGTLNK